MNASLGIAMLGCGHIAKQHSRMLRSLDPSVRRYGASRFPARAEDFARDTGADGWFASYDAALSAPHIDAVLVATPPLHHLAVTLERAGAREARDRREARVPPAGGLRSRAGRRRGAGRRVFVAENYAYKPLARVLQRSHRAAASWARSGSAADCGEEPPGVLEGRRRGGRRWGPVRGRGALDRPAGQPGPDDGIGARVLAAAGRLAGAQHGGRGAATRAAASGRSATRGKPLAAPRASPLAGRPGFAAPRSSRTEVVAVPVPGSSLVFPGFCDMLADTGRCSPISSIRYAGPRAAHDPGSGRTLTVADPRGVRNWWRDPSCEPACERPADRAA